MKKIFVSTLLLLALIITFVSSSLCYVKPIDITSYSSKYKRMYGKNITMGVMLSDCAVIAEYTDKYNDQYLVFTPVETLYGDEVAEPFYLNVWSAEYEARFANSQTIEDGNYISDPDLSKYGPFFIGAYGRKLYQEDLTKGEKYVLVMKKYDKKGWQHDRFYLNYNVIATLDYPLNEKDIENPEKYVSVLDYIKYIQKTEGYGYLESELYEAGKWID